MLRLTCLALAIASLHAGLARAELKSGDAPAAPAAAGQPKLRIVVMDFDVSGIPARTGRIVADNLVAELRKLDGASVVGMSEVRAMLAAEAERLTAGCDESGCMAEIADALGADVVLSGGIAVLDDNTVFSLRRLEPAKAVVTGTFEQRLVAAGGSELLAAVGPAVEKLFGDMPLKAGTTRGVPKERALLLNPPPLPPWATLTVGGAALATAAAGVLLGVLAATTADAAQKAVDESVARPQPGALIVQQAQSSSTLALSANIAYVSAGALAASAGVMALFTDWRDAANASALE